MRRLRHVLLSLVGPPAMRLMAGSWRVEVVGPSPWDGRLSEGAPYVLLCWHEVLLPVLWHHRGRGIAAMVSQADDGELLARLAVRLGYQLIRGSSSRGQTRALLSAVRTLRQGVPVGITPDGPRGPARVIKAGALQAARKGGASILPVHAAPIGHWRARSWDRFVVPRPGTRIRLGYGPLIRIDPGPGGLARGAEAVVDALAQAERLTAWHDAVATPIA